MQASKSIATCQRAPKKPSRRCSSLARHFYSARKPRQHSLSFLLVGRCSFARYAPQDLVENSADVSLRIKASSDAVELKHAAVMVSPKEKMV